MKKTKGWLIVSVLMIVSIMLSACAAATTAVPTTTPVPATPTVAASTTPLVVGMLYVGPYNDMGWSQAHYDAATYFMSKMPGVKMIYVDKANSSDRPGTTEVQLAESLMQQGANVMVFTSDDMKDDAIAFAKKYPNIPVIYASGDTVWKDGQDYQNLPNMVNIMGRIEDMKMIAGCAAALTTQTGQIGFLGALINDETRRLAASAYLGAEYCWTKYLGKNAADLKFKVTWIGYWFNIPGTTADPSQVADDFYNSGYDVVISGIDTTEALVEANNMNAAGKKVYAISYDYSGGCQQAEASCLGVPYFNWGPLYVKYLTEIQNGTYTQAFDWAGPDWSNINNPDTGAVGFNKGGGLSSDNSATIDKFIAEMANGLNLWTGPINLQDKSVYLTAGQVATDQQIWYLPQLLEGMDGQSVTTN